MGNCFVQVNLFVSLQKVTHNHAVCLCQHVYFKQWLLIPNILKVPFINWFINHTVIQVSFLWITESLTQISVTSVYFLKKVKHLSSWLTDAHFSHGFNLVTSFQVYYQSFCFANFIVTPVIIVTRDLILTSVMHLVIRLNLLKLFMVVITAALNWKEANPSFMNHFTILHNPCNQQLSGFH